jgi:hypothetical protein
MSLILLGIDRLEPPELAVALRLERIRPAPRRMVLGLRKEGGRSIYELRIRSQGHLYERDIEMNNESQDAHSRARLELLECAENLMLAERFAKANKPS